MKGGREERKEGRKEQAPFQSIPFHSTAFHSMQYTPSNEFFIKGEGCIPLCQYRDPITLLNFYRNSITL